MTCCEVCRLGLTDCWSRNTGAARICQLVGIELDTIARGEIPLGTYRDFVRRQSDPNWSPPPPELIGPDGPKVTRADMPLPVCPDRGDPVDNSPGCACRTWKCGRFTRIVTAGECWACSEAGFVFQTTTADAARKAAQSNVAYRPQQPLT